MSSDERKLCLLASLLLPLRLAKVHDPKEKPLAQQIVREGLKWKAKDGEVVAALHADAPRLLSVHRALSVS